MTKPISELTKTTCLYREITNGVILVQHGLGEIQRLHFTVNEYHIALLLLASGFERLLKACSCLFHRMRSGEYPDKATMKKCWGHDLVGLLEAVAKECEAARYAERCQAFKDDVALLSDSDLCHFVEILSAFGCRGRYHNFDVVGGDSDARQYDESRWLVAQTNFLVQKQEGQSRPQDLPRAGDPLTEKMRRETVSLMEKLARALARLLVFGTPGEQAERTEALVKDFLDLADEKLGTRHYGGFGGAPGSP